MSKTFRILLSALSIFSLLFVLLYAFMLWPVSDDMHDRFLLRNQSVMEFTKQIIIADPRWISPISIFRFYTMKYLPHSLNIIMYIIFYYASMYVILFHILKFKAHNKFENIIFYAFFTLIFFYGLDEITSEVVFWQVGGIYTIYLLLGCLWIVSFNKLSSNTTTSSVREVFVYIILSLFLGASTYNLTCGLIAYGVIYYICVGYNQYQKTLPGLILMSLILFLLISYSINSERLNENNSLEIRIFSMIRAFIHAPISGFKFSIHLIIFLLVYSVTKYIYMPDRTVNENVLDSLKSIVYYFIYPVAALASILPILIATNLMSARVVLYFAVFMAIFFLQFYSKILSFFFKVDKQRGDLAAVIILIFLIGHIFVFADNYYIAYSILKQKNHREALLKEKSRENASFVEVEPYTFENVPITLIHQKNHDISPNLNDWRNRQWQVEFGIDTIIAKKP